MVYTNLKKFLASVAFVAGRTREWFVSVLFTVADFAGTSHLLLPR